MTNWHLYTRNVFARLLGERGEMSRAEMENSGRSFYWKAKSAQLLFVQDGHSRLQGFSGREED